MITYKISIVLILLFSTVIAFILLHIFLLPVLKKNPPKNEFIRCLMIGGEKCENRLLSDIFFVCTHFVLYFILGLLIPNQWLFIFITIIIWEISEKILGIYHEWYKDDFKIIADIIADILGYYLGMLVINT